MAKPEWGTKRLCQSCGDSFYDLNKETIVCPKCGAEFDAEAFLKPRRSRPVAAEKKEVVAAPKSKDAKADKEDVLETEDAAEKKIDDIEDIEDIDAVEDDDEDADILKVVSELDDDDDEVAAVREQIKPDDS